MGISTYLFAQLDQPKNSTKANNLNFNFNFGSSVIQVSDTFLLFPSVTILGVLTPTAKSVFTIADHKLEMSGQDQVFVELKKPLS